MAALNSELRPEPRVSQEWEQLHVTVSCSFLFTGKASSWKAKFTGGNCVCLIPATKKSEIDYNVLPTIAW